jgi:predicted dienelactone hydrolase
VAQPYKPEAGPWPVADSADTWRDPQRDREVPVRLYAPERLTRRWPLVIFSPGLGSSRDGYAYLGRHWAGHGYLAVHLTHPGTDAAALRGPDGRMPKPIKAFLAEVPHRIDRPRDVSFVLDQLARRPAWSERIDWGRIAVAGHSFGAYTALALVGLTVDLPERPNSSFADERVRAAIAMSPPGDGKFGLHANSWAAVSRPVMSLTGTKDIEYGVGSAARRRTTFDRCPGPDQYLLTIQGATHSTFDDQRDVLIKVRPTDPAHHAYIRMATTAFLDAYLGDDQQAARWLVADALTRLSDGAVTLERKCVTALGLE